MPDHERVLQEFYWQTLDLQPRYPRIQRFLQFWRREIDARIKQVTIHPEPHLPAASWSSGIILKLD